jgi:GSH-dependent disulfide-bond oxidoreductase
MIDLYHWPTPNGFKITIMLEECGLPYTVIPVNITKGDQFKPEFLAISPNNRMPAIVDHAADGGPLSLFESGAILMYLAEKTGRFMPSTTHGRYEVLQWLFWQVAGLGPMAGQAGHFRNYAPEPLPYAVDRYTREVNRLFGVMDRRLKDRECLAGAYSIADMACWPWVRPWERLAQQIGDFPHLRLWFESIGERPAVQRAVEVGVELTKQSASAEEARKILFGQTAKSVGATD